MRGQYKVTGMGHDGKRISHVQEERTCRRIYDEEVKHGTLWWGNLMYGYNVKGRQPKWLLQERK